MLSESSGREFKEGDLGFMAYPGEITWIVEVLKVNRFGYDARLTRLELDEKSGKYIPSFNTGTLAFVERERMQELGTRIDSEYFAKWQKYVAERKK